MRVVARVGVLGAVAAVVVAQAAAQAPAPAPAEGTAGAALPDAEAARRALVYAQGDGFVLTVGALEDRIAALPLPIREQLASADDLRAYAEDLVAFELLAREAKARGHGDHPAVRRAAAEARVQQLLRRDFDARFGPETVSSEDARAYFEAHREDFGRPELRRASHVLVATREEAAALLEAARGMDANAFRALAREKSLDDATRSRGGDLRYFAADGRMPGSPDPGVEEALAKAAFAVDAVDSTYPEPIAVGERWSVLRLTARRAPETRTFEQLEGNLRLRLAHERREAAVDALVAELRRTAAVTVFAEALQFDLALPEPPAPHRPPGVTPPRSPFAPTRTGPAPAEPAAPATPDAPR